MQEKKKFSKQMIYNLLICVFAAILLWCVISLINYNRQTAESEKEFTSLKEQIHDLENEEDGNPQFVKVNDVEIVKDFESLYKANTDFAGWIAIEGTKIDYPVVHIPGDNEFYLNHDFYKEKSKSGVVFVDGRVDLKEGNNLIVYGHNMRSGTMFADLLNYAEKDYCKEHSVINFDTIFQKGQYEVVAAFYTEAYPDDDTEHFNFYHYTDISDVKTFEEYKKNIEKMSVIPCGEFSHTDSLLTLVTCSYHSADGRFVVVAKKINE